MVYAAAVGGAAVAAASALRTVTWSHYRHSFVKMQCSADRNRNGAPATMWYDEMDGACCTTKEVRKVKAVRF